VAKSTVFGLAGFTHAWKIAEKSGTVGVSGWGGEIPALHRCGFNGQSPAIMACGDFQGCKLLYAELRYSVAASIYLTLAPRRWQAMWFATLTAKSFQ
jgi:hypothetical protein